MSTVICYLTNCYWCC